VAASVCIIIERQISGGFSGKKQSGGERKFNVFKRSAKSSRIVKERSSNQVIKGGNKYHLGIFSGIL